MSIRPSISTAAAGLFALAFAAAATGEAQAQANVLKECGSQYQAAKAANQLNGQSWQEYLKACRTRVAEPAAPAAAAPAAAPMTMPAPPPAASAPAPAPMAPMTMPAQAPAPSAAPAAPAAPSTAAAPAKPATSGQAAARERQKQCGVEWKAKKAEIRKTDPKASWPKFWSECNKRLKGEGQ
jgi:hypothetical protein